MQGSSEFHLHPVSNKDSECDASRDAEMHTCQMADVIDELFLEDLMAIV